MLRVRTIHAGSAASSARYYTRYLAQGGPNEEGVWLGRQADGLGLSGVVATGDLESLLSGYNPGTGTRLGTALVDRYDAKGRVIRAVAGFDATFSGPKSLSVWWALTGDPGLLEAHDVAVAAALEHLERYGATTRVRVDGARQHPDVHGLTMARFRQHTSREDDPQLHTHVVISTKVRAPDGRWTALDAHYLKGHQRAVGGLYQSVLRAELTERYGVAWGPIVDGQAEIGGLPQELLAVFSKRSAQVDEMLAIKLDAFREREGRDPTRRERAAITREAAADSRDTKTGMPVDELVPRWHAEAGELDWTPRRTVEHLQAAAREAPAAEPVTIRHVLDQLSTVGSTWGRAEVLQAVCDLSPTVSGIAGHRWAASLESATDRVVESCTTLDPPAVGTPTRTSDGRSIWIAPIERHLTSEGILAEEERVLAFALDAHSEPPPPSPTLERAGLDVLQADAAASVAGHDPLVLVVGPAGTGKTTALRRAAEDLHRQKRRVFGVAPTAKAAKVLQLRNGSRRALDAYLDHDRVTGDPLTELLDETARRWVEHADTGQAVAVTAETNEHVRLLNTAIQNLRRDRGDLGVDTVGVAHAATASVGDVVVTRRNERALRTDRGQPVRNRERWVVTGIGRHGGLTVSHLGGHGTITLPADYVRSQVQLGYAATAHGHQGDTVDVGLTLVTSATSHRSLYVGATRGRDYNHLLVLAESDDPTEARDVLERVLTNDRADVPP